MGRRRVLDAWMCRRPALGHQTVILGGVKLQTVTNRSSEQHAERKIERWAVARTCGRLSLGFRGKKTCGSGELNAKKGRSRGPGRVQRAQDAGTGGAAGWMRPPGGRVGGGAPALRGVR